MVASDNTVNSEFGTSVAIDADSIVIGASGNDFAYVFTKVGLDWTQQATLVATDGASGDRFGSSVAISGDTIVVGADQSDDFKMAVNGNGIAYVYFRSVDSGWSEQTKLTDPAAEARFGSSVAIDGDSIVIGESDCAVVFTFFEGMWTEQAKLKASDDIVGSGFGLSVAIDAYIIVVGAPWDVTTSGIARGCAYVNIRSAGGWTEQTRLTALDGKAKDEIGWSVALDGNTRIRMIDTVNSWDLSHVGPTALRSPSLQLRRSTKRIVAGSCTRNSSPS